MSKLYKADLHIHTALSPCASNEMTPLTILKKSQEAGLDVIAITDHNSCRNVSAIIEAFQNTSIKVIPGIEVQSKEEVHLISLFTDIGDCIKFQKEIDCRLPEVLNNEKFFGEQIIFDKFGQTIAKEKKMLLNSVQLTVEEVFNLVEANNGICIPAHIDRPSYSILSNLGSLPDLPFHVFEIANLKNLEVLKRDYPELSNYNFISSSDAHYPDQIGKSKTFFNIKNISMKEVKKALIKPNLVSL